MIARADPLRLLLVGNINWFNFREFHVRPFARAGHRVTVLSDEPPARADYASGLDVVVLDRPVIGWRSLCIAFRQALAVLFNGRIAEPHERRRIRFLFNRSLVFGRQVRDLEQGYYDVVHCHFLTRPVSVAVFAARMNLPLVATIHGSDIYVSPGYSVTDRAYIRMAFDQASFVLVPGSAEFAEAARHGCRAEKLVATPWGVDTRAFFPPADEAAAAALKRRWGVSDRFVILSVRNLREIYNVESIVKAFAGLELDRPAVLMLVGDGDEEPRIRALVETLGIADRVEFLGRRPHAELSELYRLSDLSVQNPHSDALPYSLLESAASGTPMVCGRLGSIGDVAQKFARAGYGDCWFQRTGTQHERALRELMREAAQRGRKYYANDLGYLRFFETHYSLRASVERVEEIYRRAAAHDRLPRDEPALPPRTSPAELT